MKWIVWALALAAPTIAASEERRLSNAEINSIIYQATRVTTNTSNAGHDCLVRLASLQDEAGACRKFRSLTGYAYDQHFQLDSILKADPYLNPLNIDMDGVYTVRRNYAAIRETERVLDDMGFDGRHEHQ